MSYLENKFETVIKFLDKPVSCLTQVDVDAVTALLKDMQDELDNNKYKLIYYKPNGGKQYIVKSVNYIEALNLNIVEEDCLSVYTEEETNFEKSEIKKLKHEYDLINWDNVICIKQNSGKEEQ